MPVGVAVVGDELDVRPALGHAPDEGEVTAYGPQPSRRWYVVIAAINYEDSSRRSLLAHPPDHRIRGLIEGTGERLELLDCNRRRRAQRRTVRLATPSSLARSSCVSPVVASNTASRAWGSNVVVLSVSSMGGPVRCLKSLRAICSVGGCGPLSRMGGACAQVSANRHTQACGGWRPCTGFMRYCQP